MTSLCLIFFLLTILEYYHYHSTGYSSRYYLLAELGSITFSQAFAKGNTPEDMSLYLQQAFSPEIQEAELADPACVFWLVSEAGTVVGYTKLHSGLFLNCLTTQKALKISRLYVLKQFWGKGIGTQLLNEINQYAQEKGFESLWLTVWDQNPGAIKLYQKLGFKIVGDEDFILGQDVQHDFIMEKIL